MKYKYEDYFNENREEMKCARTVDNIIYMSKELLKRGITFNITVMSVDDHDYTAILPDEMPSNFNSCVLPREKTIGGAMERALYNQIDVIWQQMCDDDEAKAKEAEAEEKSDELE